MKDIKIQKDRLRAIVQRNRDQHREQFERAFEGYRAECMSVLERNLQALKRGERVRVLIAEVAPEDHTEDYERVLLMLELSVEEVISLDERSFAQYVQDDWTWRHSWAVSNSKYLNR